MTSKPAIDTLPTVAQSIADAEAQLGDRGGASFDTRGPNASAESCSGDDEAELHGLADQIVEEIQQAIGQP